MQKHRVSILLAAMILLSACSADRIPGVYRIDVQQGNVVSQDAVNQLTPGMSKRQVRYIMGTPLIVDVFHQDRWDYYYAYNPGSDGTAKASRRHITLYFQNDNLAKLEGDLRPVEEAQKPKVADPVPVTLKPAKRSFTQRVLQTFGFDGEEPAATDEAATGEDSTGSDGSGGESKTETPAEGSAAPQ